MNVAARRRRGRQLAVIAGMGVVGAAALVALTVRLASSPEVNANLGAEEFVVGSAEARAAAIERDDYPLLFPDLRGGDLDIYVQHLGRQPEEGWLAFEAKAPGAPRRCQLRWEQARRRFRDPCTSRTYPADGAGLRQFAVRVEDGTVVVDLRRPPPSPSTSTSSPPPSSSQPPSPSTSTSSPPPFPSSEPG